MSSPGPVASPPMVVKKHKKHKSEKREREEKPGLKLILKVGSQNTPEHDKEFDSSSVPVVFAEGMEEPMQVDSNDPFYGSSKSHHKKSKKKKKKKDKNKDREKRHKHHHKDKKRKREENEENDDAEVYPEIGSPSRELRTCVIKKLQERTPLSKGLDHLLGQLEKKDPQNFFAWPVTDNIAPGYFSIITHPMDFSTMRQKIEENQYSHLDDFVSDFKLMCENAMKYNHVETVYYKTSKKLLQAGLKMMMPDKMGWMLNLVPEITSEDVGFEITAEMRAVKQDEPEDGENSHENKRKLPVTKFEAVPDVLTTEEILAKSQIAARQAKAKLVMKRGPSMGFLKQKKDGSTHLNILVGGEGVIPGTKKRPILLGQLCGKLSEGSNQIQGFREDRRNIGKPVKPLYYGAFGSYAPSYDSAFSNLSKEESDLVYQTYGSDTAVQYAESVQDFVKESDYATHLVDSLLDLLTGGDHSKTKRTLEENKNFREEEAAVKTALEVKPVDDVRVDVDELKSLKDLGIDVDFLDTMNEDIIATERHHDLQQRLDGVRQLLETLQRTQHRRLSALPPANLSNCVPPDDEERRLADDVVDGLAEMAKRTAPGDVAAVAAVRKALGVPQEVAEVSNIDLESELRQFLESDPTLTQSPLRDDHSIEEILMD